MKAVSVFWILTPDGACCLQIFPPSSRLPFHLPLVSFAVQKFSSLIRSHFFSFAFISIILRGGSRGGGGISVIQVKKCYAFVFF